MRACGHSSTTPWARRSAGSKVRLGLSSLYSSICTNPRVIQWFVHLDAVRRALSSPFRGRFGKAGAVEIQAPFFGARRGYRISQALPKPRRASSFCYGVGPRGMEPPPNACFEGTSVNIFLCGEQASATAAALRQRCNVASSWAMDVCRRLQPRGTRPKHTQHCAVLEFAPLSWLVCAGFKIRMLRLVP